MLRSLSSHDTPAQQRAKQRRGPVTECGPEPPKGARKQILLRIENRASSLSIGKQTDCQSAMMKQADWYCLY